jgi:hypothetical protein
MKAAGMGDAHDGLNHNIGQTPTIAGSIKYLWFAALLRWERHRYRIWPAPTRRRPQLEPAGGAPPAACPASSETCLLNIAATLAEFHFNQVLRLMNNNGCV